VGDQVGRRERLLNAEHVELGQATEHRHVLVAVLKEPLASTWSTRSG